MRPIWRWNVPAIVVASTIAVSGWELGQQPRLPAGRLEFRTASAEFRPDHTFTIETLIEGLGTLRFTEAWEAESEEIAFVGFKVEAGSELLEKSRIPAFSPTTASSTRTT